MGGGGGVGGVTIPRDRRTKPRIAGARFIGESQQSAPQEHSQPRWPPAARDRVLVGNRSGRSFSRAGIHSESPRAEEPRGDTAPLSPTPSFRERALGHEPGAFTDARTSSSDVEFAVTGTVSSMRGLSFRKARQASPRSGRPDSGGRGSDWRILGARPCRRYQHVSRDRVAEHRFRAELSIS